MLHLQLCDKCLGSAAALEDLKARLNDSEISHQVRIETIDCGETCEKPARLWIQHSEGASYQFDGLNLSADQDDILATAVACLESPNGWIEDARPCGRLRFCLIARVPA